MTDSTETARPDGDLAGALAAEEGGRRWIRRAAVLAVVVVLVAFGVVWRATHKPAAEPRFMTVESATGDVIERVTATGVVQPVLQVNVGSQVNGRVTQVLVDFNSVVKKGDVLAEIDATVFGAQVSQVQAQLAVQRAQLESARASMAAAKASFERIEKLVAQNLASRAELDTSRGQYDMARAQVAATEAQIASIQAQLTQSRTNVAFTKIYSPVDGVVIGRSIDPGATVVASFQAAVLFVIAQDLRKMRVMADVDEADVGRIAERMQAEATVDAFPGDSFKGTVQQVRYSPNNVQGVVTYSAVIEVDNREEKLRPGMTATVLIRTREAKGAVRVPNAALRYKPSPPPAEPGKAVVPVPEAPLPKGQGRLYVVTDTARGSEKAEARLVGVGVTDGIFTEIVSGLGAGETLVVDENEAADDGVKKKRKRVL